MSDRPDEKPSPYPTMDDWLALQPRVPFPQPSSTRDAPIRDVLSLWNPDMGVVDDLLRFLWGNGLIVEEAPKLTAAYSIDEYYIGMTAE